MAKIKNLTNEHILNTLTDYYVIYKATNKINGKSYIGISKDFKERQRTHFKSARNNGTGHFQKAIRKYGEDAFEWTIYYQCSSEYSASTSEQMLIKHFDTYKNGYNMTTGGEVGWSKVTSKETREKLSKILKGRTYEEIHGKEKARLIKEKQSKTHKGKMVSKETRRRMSEANKKRWKNGTPIGRKGKPCMVNGIKYKNCKEAYKTIGIRKEVLLKWIRNNTNGACFL